MEVVNPVLFEWKTCAAVAALSSYRREVLGSGVVNGAILEKEVPFDPNVLVFRQGVSAAILRCLSEEACPDHRYSVSLLYNSRWGRDETGTFNLAREDDYRQDSTR